MLGTLLGNYRVVDELGQGGMGVVYVGRHETLGHRVVVKVLQPELSSHAEMVQRFFNEAQAATAIRNPGIVQVFDFGTTPDARAYIVMELLEGETLAARLKQRRYDHTEGCRLGRQVANVLQAAHVAGITHRDLKPDNLFLVPDPEVYGGERVKVLDFGIAKLAGESRARGVKTRTDLIMGTPHYMSPEQCRSASAADARSDIYSLGCILFQVACGRPPFITGGLGDIVAAHLHDPPPHPQHLAPDIPPGLSALIVKMLAKQPGARPQTMTAVSHALDEILRTVGRPSAHATMPLSPRAPAPLSTRAPTPPSPRAPTPLSAAPAPLPVSSATSLPAHLQLLAPQPSPVPQATPASTTLRVAVGSTTPPRGSAHRMPFVLGAIVIVGAVTAIAIVLANEHPRPPDPLVSYNDITATSRTADAASQDAAVAQPVAPLAQPVAPLAQPVTPHAKPAVVEAVPPQRPKPANTVAELEATCRAYQLDRKWDELKQCADKLKLLDPERAPELRTRAMEEARSAPRIAAVQTALSNKDLKRARTEIDQVWTESVEYAKLKRSYDIAEAQAIDALATLLDSVKDASCEAYNQLLMKERAVSPRRVTAEAVRRVPCTPPPKCSADALAEKAQQQFNANQLTDSLASYDAAYACKPTPTLLQKAFVVACNLRDPAKAKSYWKRLPATLRTQAVGVCVRNGITAETLDAP